MGDVLAQPDWGHWTHVCCGPGPQLDDRAPVVRAIRRQPRHGSDEVVSVYDREYAPGLSTPC